MARAGLYKSDVKKARDALLAQGKHPSIDAVRAQLGNTGSKTTIHRHLRELEEEEGAGFGHGVAVSEALQDLVTRLAARLHEEAAAQIEAVRGQCAAQLAERDAAGAALQQELERLNEQLQQAQAARQSERQAHDLTRQALQAAEIAVAQHGQQVKDLLDRLAENEVYRRSLEDKLTHARESLEHFRQASKEQRDQELRRHEHQFQQLQLDLRRQADTLTDKQKELAQLYQESARATTELAATRKELHQCEQARDKEAKPYAAAIKRLAELETKMAVLVERAQQAGARAEKAEVSLAAVEAQLAQQGKQTTEQEAELQLLRGRILAQAELIATVLPSANAASTQA